MEYMLIYIIFFIFRPRKNIPAIWQVYVQWTYFINQNNTTCIHPTFISHWTMFDDGNSFNDLFFRVQDNFQFAKLKKWNRHLIH